MLLFDPSIYHYTLHAIMVLTVGAGIVSLGVFVLVRERWSRGGFKFFLFTSAVGLWMFGFGMAYASIWEPSAFRWFLAGEVGVMFVPPTVLSLAVSLVQRDSELRAQVWLSIAIAMLFCSILLTTNLLFRSLQLYSWGWYPLFGWVGVLFSAYFAVVGIFIIGLYYRKYRRTTHVRTRRRLGWVLSALCIGYLASADFAPSLGIPLYPFGYIPAAICLIVLTYITVQYRLMDIRPELATGLILETMHGAVIVVDLEDKVRVINNVAGEMLGVGRRELLGRSLTDVLSAPADLTETVHAGDRAGPREMTWTGKDGRRFDVALSAAPILDGRDRAPVGIVYVAHDITDLKRAEERLTTSSEELRDANRRLEELDRVKSDLITIVSHELRTPITSIKAFSELLLMKPGMHEERKTMLLQKISDESDRLARLINDLLDISRIESGSMSWRSEAVSLSEIIHASVEAMMPIALNKGVALGQSIDGTLQGLFGDRDRLLQVMTNLLSNAVKFTPAGGSITVTACREEGPPPRFVVNVRDTGAGIAADDLPYIFEKFRRGRSAEEGTAEGSGLGLAISSQIVEHYGGTIRAASVPGAGSIFTVTLPADCGAHDT